MKGPYRVYREYRSRDGWELVTAVDKTGIVAGDEHHTYEEIVDWYRGAFIGGSPEPCYKTAPSNCYCGFDPDRGFEPGSLEDVVDEVVRLVDKETEQ